MFHEFFFEDMVIVVSMQNAPSGRSRRSNRSKCRRLNVLLTALTASPVIFLLVSWFYQYRDTYIMIIMLLVLIPICLYLLFCMTGRDKATWVGFLPLPFVAFHMYYFLMNFVFSSQSAFSMNYLIAAISALNNAIISSLLAEWFFRRKLNMLRVAGILSALNIVLLLINYSSLLPDLRQHWSSYFSNYIWSYLSILSLHALIMLFGIKFLKKSYNANRIELKPIKKIQE